jgi:serine protease AprX
LIKKSYSQGGKTMPILPFFLLLPLLLEKNFLEKNKCPNVKSSFYLKNKIYNLQKGKVDPGLQDIILKNDDSIGRFIIFANRLEQDLELLKNNGYKVVHSLPFIDAYIVEGSSENIRSLESIKDIHYIMGDSEVQSHMDIVGKSLHINRLNHSSYSGEGVGIAIMDTGIFPHVDFLKPSMRLVAFKDFIHKKKEPYDDNGHGTFVAGVAAGSGYASGGKYRGVAPDADIIGVKVMAKNGSGNTTDILAGFQWVVDHKERLNIKVLSLSFGIHPQNIKGLDVLSMAVEEIWKKGITVVASAGNGGPEKSTITSPGGSPSVITVGALDDKRTIDIGDDVVAEISSRGPSYTGSRKPDIMAPGINVTSVNADTKYSANQFSLENVELYRSMSGTSVSAPIVSGMVALLLQKNKNWNPNQVKRAFIDTALRLDADVLSAGYGRVFLPDLLAYQF